MTAFLSPLSFLKIEGDTLNVSTVPQHFKLRRLMQIVKHSRKPLNSCTFMLGSLHKGEKCTS